jgi:NTE family protein
VRASTGLPGYFPPFYLDGDLYLDGGILDNIPVGTIREIYDGSVIVSDVGALAKMETYGPEFRGRSGWRFLLNRLNPLTETTRVPLIPEMLLRAIEVGRGQTHRNEAVLGDFTLPPPVSHFGWFDPRAIPKIAEVGYRSALEEIAHWDRRALHLTE